MFDLVIRHGTVVTPGGILRADLAADGERISAIGQELAGGRREIDAGGLVLFPGVVDVHVHFNEPGRADWEGADTGSRAFAAGGGTTFIDMPLNSTPCTLNAGAFARKREALQAASRADFALWGGLVPGNRGELAEMAAAGAVGFKAFLCDSGLPDFPRADDLTLYEGMKEAARLGLPVAVHAESEEIAKGLSSRLRARGRTDVQAFLESRPVIAETAAIRGAGALARETGCRLHIVHISSGSGVAAALESRALGADVTLETCPHYLFFSEEDLERIGAPAKCAPPLRSLAERELLWASVLRGEVDIVGSDHSPCPPEMKEKTDFFEVWGGIAGVQMTLLAMLTKGYAARGLPWEAIAAMTAGNGARRFGLMDKGALEVGRHADIALVDPRGATDITLETLLHRHRDSPYLGLTMRAAIKRTILRGDVSGDTRGNFVRPVSPNMRNL